MLTHHELLQLVAEEKKHAFISTGMSTIEEIEKAVQDGLNNLQEKPTCILLKTQKGKGVSFLQNPTWHAKVPNEEEYKKALEELE